MKVVIVCLVFYAVSLVLQLFNGDTSQIYVSLIIFNQYLTSPFPNTGGPVIQCYSHDPERQDGEPLLPVFERLWSVAAEDRTHDLPLMGRTL